MNVNFVQWVFDQSVKHAEKLAFIDGYETVTYVELARRTRALAAHFNDLGLRPGDHVIINMEDSVDWPVVFLTCLYINLIPLPLSMSIGDRLLEKIAKFVNCRHIFASDSASRKYPTDIALTKRSDLRVMYNHNTTIDPIFVHPDSPAWLNISSGSTGFPKVAVHRHQTLFEILALSPKTSYSMTSNSTIMSVAKMSWNFGLHNSITYNLGLGSTAVVIPDPPAAPIVFDYMHRFRPDIVVTSPSIIQRLLKSDLKYSIPNSVVHFHSSGEHLNAVHYAHFQKRFGLKINSCIGMMETCTNYAANPDWEHDAGTVGKALPGCQVKLVDTNGQECLETNKIGEIWINSPANAHYYLHDYHRTRQTFVGEWVRSGDLAYRNNRDNLVFVGRIDDSFKVSDLIVNPVEIENVLLENDSIEQICIVGKTNALGTNEIHAFLVVRSNFDLPAFKDYCKKVLFSHQCPKYFTVTESLPETMTNKKDRKTMRARLETYAT